MSMDLIHNDDDRYICYKLCPVYVLLFLDMPDVNHEQYRINIIMHYQTIPTTVSKDACPTNPHLVLSELRPPCILAISQFSRTVLDSKTTKPACRSHCMLRVNKARLTHNRNKHSACIRTFITDQCFVHSKHVCRVYPHTHTIYLHNINQLSST